MSTVVRGNAAEAAVLQAAAAAGFHVLVPFGEGLPFDLGVVTCGGEILRIQVKSGRVRRGCVEFNSASTDHGHGQRHYRGRADLIAVHVADLCQVFVLPVDDCPTSRGFLRLQPARNNQQRGVRRADDYSFEAWAASAAGC
jgi:PD-(D/E)XK endonuclease